MSSFSDRLSFFSKRSGMNAKYLSEASGIEYTLLVKIRNGTRPAASRESLQKLMDVLQLSVSERAELTSEWEIEKVGELLYNQFLAIRKMVESMKNIPSLRMTGETGTEKDMILEGSRELSNRADLGHALHLILEAAGNKAGERVEIHTNSLSEGFMNHLSTALREYPSMPVYHILSLLPVRAAKETPVTNIERITQILPLFYFRNNYHSLTCHEENITADNYFLFPNVVISNSMLMIVNNNWDRGLMTGDPHMIQGAHRLFEEQYHVSRPINVEFFSLQQEMDFFTKQYQKNGTNWRYAVSCQPCILHFVTENDIASVTLSPLIPDSILQIFCDSYRNLPPLQLKNRVTFFMREGLIDFMETGVIEELPTGAASPLPMKNRVQILRRMIQSAKTGQMHPRMIKPERMSIPYKTSVNCQNSLSYITLPSRDIDPNVRGYFMLESGLAALMWNFMTFLDERDFWTWSEAETIRIMEETLSVYERAEQDTEKSTG